MDAAKILFNAWIRVKWLISSFFLWVFIRIIRHWNSKSNHWNTEFIHWRQIRRFSWIFYEEIGNIPLSKWHFCIDYYWWQHKIVINQIWQTCKAILDWEIVFFLENSRKFCSWKCLNGFLIYFYQKFRIFANFCIYLFLDSLQQQSKKTNDLSQI